MISEHAFRASTTPAEIVQRHGDAGALSERPARPLVAVALAAGLLIVAAFQAALTFGAPFGSAALGGTSPGRLPDAVRLVTGFSAVVWLFAALVVLARGGRALVALPEAVSRVGTRILVGLLGVGAVMNLASTSPWERYGWGPFTLIMLTLCVVLVRSALPGDAPSQATRIVHARIRRRVMGGLGIALHCTIVAFAYYGSLLLAPGYAVYSLWILWALFLALAVYFLPRRPAWTLAVPAVAFTVWLGVMALGDWLLGWVA